jgi:hypothetical protein
MVYEEENTVLNNEGDYQDDELKFGRQPTVNNNT